MGLGSWPVIVKIPLILDPQPEGGYTVTSPVLPELITEGDTLAEAQTNAGDAFAAVAEIYEDGGRAPPRHPFREPAQASSPPAAGMKNPSPRGSSLSSTSWLKPVR